jgi:hypothetical protein
VSKLPYDNESKDAFRGVEYKLLTDLTADAGDAYIMDMSSVDPSLTSYMAIDGNANHCSVSLDALDGYRTGTRCPPVNGIVIVDVTRGDYGKIDLIDRAANVTRRGVECLGVMPVLVSPVNAMFYQRIISSETTYDAATGIEYTPNLSAYQPVTDAMARSGVRFGQIDKRNFDQDLSSNTLAGESVSKAAVDYFPNIAFNLSSTLDRSYLKSIGVVVFKVAMDPSNDNKISFVPVESFVGQLDKNAKN